MKPFLIFCLTVLQASAATWYIDSSAKGSNTGTSWTNAYTTILKSYSDGKIKSGDTVYLSGGATGKTQSYVTTTLTQYAGQWFMVNGATYKIGQDSAHNGTAILDGNGGSYIFVQSLNGITISGDAGDGQMHFRVINAGSGIIGYQWTNMHASYINFDGINEGVNANPFGLGNEIDHCRFYIKGVQADRAMYCQIPGTAYDSALKFHDNVLLIPRGQNGLGADGIQFSGISSSTGGASFYNNSITSYYDSTWKGGQHQDGMQGAGGSYYKIYGNTITDMLNYAIFPEPFAAPYSHMQITRNICSFSLSADGGTQAIAISGNAKMPCNDVICDGNTADNYQNPFTFRNPVIMPSPNTFFNCSFTNNKDLNTKGGGNIIDPAVKQSGDSSGNGPISPPVVIPPIVVPPVVTPHVPSTLNVTVKLVIDPVSNSVLSVSATTQ